SLTNIPRTLKTGDQIEMNGRTGQVTLLSRSRKLQRLSVTTT
ncbi:MAG: hypothetical protein ACJAVK_002941, partial [Akkermansiaceae bacterium]